MYNSFRTFPHFDSVAGEIQSPPLASPFRSTFRRTNRRKKKELLKIQFLFISFTSVSLRASIRLSSDFTLFRHSSPSFGSQQICSYSNLSINLMVGRWCTLKGLPPQRLGRLYFHYAFWVFHPNTRTCVRLLGPCFKTGQWKPFRQHLDTHQPNPTQYQHFAHGAACTPAHKAPAGTGRRA